MRHARVGSVEALLALLHDVTLQNTVMDASELGQVHSPLQPRRRAMRHILTPER